MKKIILFILLLPSVALGSWSEGKIARELFFASALINDWNQTLIISKTPWRREKNKLLGPKPSRDNVNIYFSGCLIGHAAITYILPDKYAKVWQDVWIGIESNVADNNVKKGHSKKINVNYKITHTIIF